MPVHARDGCRGNDAAVSAEKYCLSEWRAAFDNPANFAMPTAGRCTRRHLCMLVLLRLRCGYLDRISFRHLGEVPRLSIGSQREGTLPDDAAQNDVEEQRLVGT